MCFLPLSRGQTPLEGVRSRRACPPAALTSRSRERGQRRPGCWMGLCGHLLCGPGPATLSFSPLKIKQSRQMLPQPPCRCKTRYFNDTASKTQARSAQTKVQVKPLSLMSCVALGRGFDLCESHFLNHKMGTMTPPPGEVLHQGSAGFSVKGQRVSILGFAGHPSSATTIQLCGFSTKAARDDGEKDGHGCVPIKLY